MTMSYAPAAIDPEVRAAPGAPIDRGDGTTGVVLIGAAFLAAIIGAMRLAESPIPRPDAPAEEVRQYYEGSAKAAVQCRRAGRLDCRARVLHAVRGAACRAVSAVVSRPSSCCMGRGNRRRRVARGIGGDTLAPRGGGARTWA